MDKLRRLGIPELGLTTILTLYETVLARVRIAEGLSDSIRNTIGVKQGCPLSSTLFGLCIDELETHIRDCRLLRWVPSPW